MAQRTRQLSNRTEAKYWMASPAETRFRLLHQFGDFYAEIFRLKQLARDAAATAEVRLPTGDGTEHGGPGGGNGNAIRASVAELLDRKAAEDKRIDDPTAAEVQRELLYIMIAVADEIFVNLEWPGRPYWQANLLEQQLFHSNVAGERIFRSIETTLVRQDEAAKELAAVYLAALGLGFRGKYWGKDDSGTIESYRRKIESALHRWGGELHAESVPPLHRPEPAQRQTPEVLPKPKRRPLLFEGIPEIQPGANSRHEASTGSRRHLVTLVACCAVTAVLSFAAGAACGLLISLHMRSSAGQEASSALRQSASAKADPPSSNKPLAHLQQASSGPESGPSVAKPDSISSSQADLRETTGPSTVSPMGTLAGLPGPSARSRRSSVASAKIESFTVQIGAFRIQENAVRLAESLKSLGYQPEVLRRTAKDARLWHVVRVGRYPDWQMAFDVAGKLASHLNPGLEPFVRPLY
jgi:type VI secretion system protein ImpK